MTRTLSLVRHALWSLAHARGTSLVALVTLSLALGAASSIVSVVNAVLIEALPYPEPDRLVLVSGVDRRGEELLRDFPMSYLDLADYRTSHRGLEELAAVSWPESFSLLSWRAGPLGAEGEPERVLVELVSAEYFHVLGVQPVAGRLFTAEEDTTPGAHPVVLVGHELWQRRFAGDPSAVGSFLDLDGRRLEVLGVLPPGFAGISDQAQLWLPVTMGGVAFSPAVIESRGYRWLQGVARLRPGVSMAAAQAELDAVTAALGREYPSTNDRVGAELATPAEKWFGTLRPALWTLLGGAGFLLLVAGANVSSLLLARASARQAEMALRGALGALRRQLFFQGLAESVLLALGGGLGGLLVARWTTPVLVAKSGVELRGFVHVSAAAPWVVAVVAAAALLCGLGCGAVPAWIACRVPASAALVESSSRGSGGRRRHRFQSALVVVQTALALVLLIGTGLMLQDFRRLLATDLGFRSDELLTLRLDLKDKQLESREAFETLMRRLRDEVRGVPGVADAALASPGIPTDFDWYEASYTLDQRSDAQTEPGTVPLIYHRVSPGYFSLLGISILKGRGFTLEDSASATRAAVVSESVARLYWPGQEALGKRLKRGERDSENPWLTVVGVAADVRYEGLAREGRPSPDVYFALLQDPPSYPPILNFLVRPTGGASAAGLAGDVRKKIASQVPDLPVYDVATMAARLERQTAQRRFLISLMALFGTLTLLLVSLGIYGLLSSTVHRRRREVGIRMALGADLSRVTRQIVGRGLALALAGVVLGLFASLALGGVLANLVAEASPTDPLTLAGSALLLVAVAGLASYFPARRAARIDPAKTLRSE